MKSSYISDLQPNVLTTALLLVHSKEIRQKKSGEPYLSLTLADRSGSIEAKMWDNVADVMNTFDSDDFVKVKGIPCIYNNRLQFTIHKMIRMDEREVNFADYFPASKRDPGEMFEELLGVVRSLENWHLRSLLERIFEDEEIAARYRRAPAAKNIHHAYLGGLIEHVLSLCRLCRSVASNYEAVDLDLLLTGAILHDIGKIEELTYDRGFGYSAEGQLIGHIIIGTRILREKLRLVPGFPLRLASLVEHMILSHHGKLEFGSPKLPMFAEAVLLHYLDDLDSKMECVRAAVEQDRQVESEWTTYCPPMERVILKKGRFLDSEAAESGPPQEPSPAAVSVESAVTEARQSSPGPIAEPVAHSPENKPQSAPPPRRASDGPPRPQRSGDYVRTPSLFGEKLAGALQEED